MRQQTVDLFSAIQYRPWAIEEIDKFGHPAASRHARNALAELQRSQREAEALLGFVQGGKRLKRA